MITAIFAWARGLASVIQIVLAIAAASPILVGGGYIWGRLDARDAAKVKALESKINMLEIEAEIWKATAESNILAAKEAADAEAKNDEVSKGMDEQAAAAPDVPNIAPSGWMRRLRELR